MSQITYRGNLSARAFPLIAEQFGRTVIVSGQDQNFNRQVVSQEDIDKDRGIPQVYYCHNVMPTAEGLQSVGYIDKYAAAVGVTDFRSIFPARGPDQGRVLIGHTASGDNYENSLITFHLWSKINTIAGVGLFTKITTAVINGQTYFCFEGLGVYYYKAATHLLTKVTLIGVVEANVIGITSSSGYLIAWTTNYIAWSSAVSHVLVGDPFDFTPSLITGAGGGAVDAAKGNITICVNHYLGFIAYTDTNAIGAIYSGNGRYPFNFKEIMGAGGLLDINLISTGSESNNHYAFTSSGLQLISMTGATTVMSDIADFVAGKYFEDFDDVTKTFSHEILTDAMNKALNVLADRYVILSYGKYVNDAATRYTHAIVFDLSQKRFGKLKIDHEATFDFGFEGISDAQASDLVRTGVGIFHRTGLIKTIDFSVGSTNSNGTLILGKYQYIRSRTITLDGINLENVFPSNAFSVTNLLSVDGKNTTLQTVTPVTPVVGNLREYACRQTGINHSLLVQGNFYLSSVVLNFHINGRR